jgi:hypothetical protein
MAYENHVKKGMEHYDWLNFLRMQDFLRRGKLSCSFYCSELKHLDIRYVSVFGSFMWIFTLLILKYYNTRTIFYFGDYFIIAQNINIMSRKKFREKYYYHSRISGLNDEYLIFKVDSTSGSCG